MLLRALFLIGLTTSSVWAQQKDATAEAPAEAPADVELSTADVSSQKHNDDKKKKNDKYSGFKDNTVGYCKMNSVSDIKAVKELMETNIDYLDDFFDIYCEYDTCYEYPIKDIENFLAVARAFINPEAQEYYYFTDREILETMTIKNVQPSTEVLDTQCADAIKFAIRESTRAFFKLMNVGRIYDVIESLDALSESGEAMPGNSTRRLQDDASTDPLAVLESWHYGNDINHFLPQFLEIFKSDQAVFDKFFHTIILKSDILSVKYILDREFTFYVKSWKEAAATAQSFAGKYAAFAVTDGYDLIHYFVDWYGDYTDLAKEIMALYANAVNVCAAPGPTPPPVSMPPTKSPTPAPTPRPVGYQIDSRFQGATDEGMTLVRLATSRFSKIITGELPDASGTGSESTACGPDPDTIDDMDICFRFRDLPDNIVAVGGPRLVRTADGVNNIPFTGEISIDPSLLNNPSRLINAAEQQILQAIGLGTLWDNQGLVTQGDGICTYDATKEASTQFRAIAGCTDTTLGVPVEPDCRHWNNACFNNVEILTPFSGLILSKITVGALMDFGYSVDMNAADTLQAEQLSPNCCMAPAAMGESSSGSMAGLSSETRAAAIEYGLAVLADQTLTSESMTVGEGVMDVSGIAVSVTVFEDGTLYNLVVSSADAV